jgi:hypothetical protein
MQLKRKSLRIIKFTVAGGVILLGIVFVVIYFVAKTDENHAVVPSTESVSAPIAVSDKKPSALEPVVEPQIVPAGGIIATALPFVRQHLPAFILSAALLVLAVMGLIVFFVLRSQQESANAEIEGPQTGEPTEEVGESKIESGSHNTITIVLSMIGAVFFIVISVFIYYRIFLSKDGG